MANKTKRQEVLTELKEKYREPLDGPAIIKALKEEASVKFDETVEIHFRLGINPKLNDQQIRSTVTLPGGTGKEVKVAVVCKGGKIDEAKEAGADIVGAEDLVEEIGKGMLDFDKLVATPDCMGMLSKMGRILGPKGLMPNPKDGTVTNDIAKTVQEVKAGKVSFRAEKTGGLVQMAIGKLSFDDERLLQNLAAVVDQIQKVKPTSVKGTYIKSIYLSSTMGPGIKLDLNTLQDLSKHTAA